LSTNPLSLCLLRLSALGDVTHVVPLVRTLQKAWPQLQLDWIIDKGGQKLLEGLEGVVFHTYDKRSSLAGMRTLRRELPREGFDALLQMQVDLLGATVRRPVVSETTALGAAYLAGLAVEYWQGLDDVTANWALDREFQPQMAAADREWQLARWKKAVSRSLAWEEKG
jgi:ADP-heptose:LPS heptosyltransferase